MNKRKRTESIDLNDATPEPIRTQELISWGDLLLVVGNPPNTELKVSSRLLILTSDVFRMMLGSRFREGKIVCSTESPPRLALPDDPAQGMIDLCALIHHKLDDVGRLAWTATRLYDFAVTVDKYGCNGAMTLQSQALLLRYLDSHPLPQTLEEGALVTAAAYLLDDARTFKEMTRRLVLRFSIPFSSLRNGDTYDVIPHRALLALEEKRAHVQSQIIDGLPLLGMPRCVNGCDNYDEKYMKNLRHAFTNSQRPPTLHNGWSIDCVIQTLRESRAVHRKDDTCCHTKTTLKVSRAELMAFAAKIEEACEGLCLMCVREDRENLYRKCKFPEHVEIA